MIRNILQKSHPVLPILTIEKVVDVNPLIELFNQYNIKVVEVTLRTAQALDVITAFKQHSDIVVGVGTVLNEDDLTKSMAAGADFAVTPGATPLLYECARHKNFNLLPGVATASEVMQGMNYGFDTFKLFPAEAVGGTKLLQSLAGPFMDIKFCPTGGINLYNSKNYLALNNVLCIGGSWLVNKQDLQEEGWDNVEKKLQQLELL